MEVGRRTRLELSELIVLARALGVPPGLLIYPHQPGGEVEVMPGLRTTSRNALSWFAGNGPLSYESDGEVQAAELREYYSGAKILTLSDQHDHWVGVLEAMDTRLATEGLTSDAPNETSAHNLRMSAHFLRGTRNEMAAMDAPLPALSPAIERILATTQDTRRVNSHDQA